MILVVEVLDFDGLQRKVFVFKRRTLLASLSEYDLVKGVSTESSE